MSRGVFLIAGVAAGVALSTWLDNATPVPPLLAFACEGLGMPGAVTMDGELVCLRPGAILGQADSVGTIVAALQEGIARNQTEGDDDADQ
jgi:hypothetical protein